MKLFVKLMRQVYPERCPLCVDLIEEGAVACDACLRKLNEKQRPITRGALGFRCVSSFVYGGRVRRMLLRVKFHGHTQHIRQIAVILEKDIRAVYGDSAFDLITFVPMHESDRKERKYNQSELLAEELSKLMGIPSLATLEKVKRTKKQHNLPYVKRKRNLSGAFRLIDSEIVKGRKILLIDDIVTSGYTLGTCGKPLSRAKPELICCAAVADALTVTDKKRVI